VGGTLQFKKEAQELTLISVVKFLLQPE